MEPANGQPAGIVLTGNFKPSPAVLQIIASLPYPVLLAEQDIYEVAFRVHNLSVKTRAADTQKVSVIRDLIAANVDVKRILQAL